MKAKEIAEETIPQSIFSTHNAGTIILRKELEKKIIAYAKQKCKEQRKICDEKALIGSDYLSNKDRVQYFIDSISILDAPEPEFE